MDIFNPNDVDFIEERLVQAFLYNYKTIEPSDIIDAFGDDLLSIAID